MTPLLAATAAAVMAGAAIQSATGFGFALLSAPLAFAALDSHEAHHSCQPSSQQP